MNKKTFFYFHVIMSNGETVHFRDISVFMSQALEAIKMVLDLTANKQIDVELLDRILVEVESISNIESTGESCETDSGGESRYGLERTSQAEVLVESLGNVLHQVQKFYFSFSPYIYQTTS